MGGNFLKLKSQRIRVETYFFFAVVLCVEKKKIKKKKKRRRRDPTGRLLPLTMERSGLSSRDLKTLPIRKFSSDSMTDDDERFFFFFF